MSEEIRNHKKAKPLEATNCNGIEAALCAVFQIIENLFPIHSCEQSIFSSNVASIAV